VHGETLLAGLPALALQALLRRLAERLEASGARRRNDVLRLAAWRLAAGGGMDPALAERAAERAMGALDASLAERCARLAGDGFAARLLLGAALAHAGKAQEADAVLRALEPPDDAARATVAIALARNAFWALGRVDEALGVLRRAEEAITDPAPRGEVRAVRLRLLSASGRPHDALGPALAMLADPSASDVAHLHAAVTAAESLLARGRAETALTVVERWRPLAREYDERLPLLALVLEGIATVALCWAGRLEDGEDAARRAYRRAVAGSSQQSVAVEATTVGYCALARGRVRTAMRFFREGVALLRESDGVGMRSWALAGIAQAAAQAGQADAARAAVAEMEHVPIRHQGFAAEVDLGRAWAAAAGGDLRRAAAIAQDAADAARAAGQDGLAARALHESCRFAPDAAAAAGLADLGRSVEGPLPACAAAHAAALVAGDGPALVVVAERFARLGAPLLAAEASTAAGRQLRAAGREASARGALARAAAWHALCEEARTPGLDRAPETEALTPREREVALLAADGLTSREIAERLVVSVRTVDNQLHRVYRKLGVRRRQELAPLLTAPPPQVE
ncbi:MAG TPA: helix-turn-helix transcriptional regulator, partial [Capillimicrobium sp.]